MSEVAKTLRDSELAAAFGEAVVRCRGDRSAAGVADAVGIHRSLLYSIENGSLSSLETSLRLSQELGFSLDVLFGISSSVACYATIEQALAGLAGDVSQKEMAAICSLSLRAIDNALRGGRPKMLTVIKLARSLGFSLDALDWRLIRKEAQSHE
jgi:transcriptional regulator with XRE-family HTH domain